MTSNTPKFTNRLAGETSPYLLQHAHNPVDWFPWGEDAFAEARRRGVPIFLSIGYSTCYWCHVMERESFEHEPTAAILNERFVPVKLDREERPDIDDLYMSAVQMLTGHGGWPMSLFLTPPGSAGEDDPGLKPFWGGTYFPRESRGGHPSFRQIMEGMSDAWTNRRTEVVQQGELIAEALRDRLGAESRPAHINEMQVGHAVGQLMQMYDSSMGGFGGAPKFPQPVFLEFLLDAAPTIREDEPKHAVLGAAAHTLERMALGGLFDQVGGGFHRYSVDAQWLVPHFEKMLYDNAQMVGLYARASVMFEDAFFEQIARRTCEYVLREMRNQSPERERGVTDAQSNEENEELTASVNENGRDARPTGEGGNGAFFSAQDAEANHREGQNYVWRLEELRAALGEEDAAFASRVYGLAQGTNFRDPHNPEDEPANVLRLAERPEVLASRFELDAAGFQARLDDVNAKLYEARAKRDQPLTDDKVIVAWNGLMIAGLADAGRWLKEPRYVDAATEAARFILHEMRDDSGGLMRVWRDGAAKTEAFLEDYAMFIRGLIALHRAGAGDEFLPAAIELAEMAQERFGDVEWGGCFDTRDGQTDLIVRSKTMHDGAMPSGGSVMIHNLLDLTELKGDAKHLDRAMKALASMSRAIGESPLGPVEATRGLLRVLMRDPLLPGKHGMGEDAESVEPDQPDDGASDDADSDSPVQVFANVEEVQVKHGAAAEIELALRISEGWHVNAHEPGVEGVAGLVVGVEGGSGVRAEVVYPKGDPLEAEWAPPHARPLVHHDEALMTVQLHRTDDEWSGAPTLVVRYQACTDRSCEAPQVVVLGIGIGEA